MSIDNRCLGSTVLPRARSDRDHRLVDTKDRYTKRHSEDVARYATFIGERIGLSVDEIQTLGLAGLLHDIGKIGIPDQILRKPGSLTEAEYAVVKQHVALGDMIVRDLSDIEAVRAGIRHHHERWDGQGYLERLAGEGIPLIARILAVADAFSAMTTTRPYRKALGVDEALTRLGDAAGTQLDERLVTAFIDGIEHDASAAIARGYVARGVPVGAGSARRVTSIRGAAIPVALVLAVAGLVGSPPATRALAVLPVAIDDSMSVVHGRLLTVPAPGVLANDLQIGSGFTATLVDDVGHGSLDLDPDGGFSYRSELGFAGTDTFRYRVDGGLLGLSNVATVTITVTNIAPIARLDAYTAVSAVVRSVAAPGLLANDDDADGDALTIDIVQPPANGSLDEAADGGFRYKSDKGFSGIDPFRYRAWDGVAWSKTVTVQMTVTAPAPTPTPTPTPKPTPTATPRTTPVPSRSPAPTPTASVSARPADPSPEATRSPDLPATPASGAGAGGGAPPDPPSAADGPFAIGATDGDPGLELDTGSVAFDTFEWAVPALVLTVPWLLVVIAVLAQALIGVAWIPVARRSLAGDRRRRPPHLSPR